MKDKLERFLSAIDAEATEPLELFIIGCSAINLGYGGQHQTKDIDVLREGNKELLATMAEKFGKESSNAKTLGLYLELVEHQFPPTPWDFNKRCRPVDGSWRFIRPYVLEPNDLVATKLYRFHTTDRRDIQHLCDLQLIDPERLRESFESAFLYFPEQYGDPKRERAFANLEIVLKYLDGKRDSI